MAACLTAEVEGNNTESAANTGLCSNTNIAGSMSSSSDLDWYKFVVSTPGQIEIRISHGTSVDFDWYFYATSGSPLMSKATSSTPETGTYTVSTTGTYFIKVNSYSGSGNYTLNVKLPSPVTPPVEPPAGGGVDKYINDTAAGLWSYANMFQRHGFSPKHILSHHDTYASNSGNTSSAAQVNIAIINEADLVYVIGGDPSRLARTFLKDDGTDSPLMAAIRARYAAGNFIYAGDSAGTAIAPATSYGEGISIGYLNQNTLRPITPADCPYVSATAASCLAHPTNPDFGTKIKGFGFVPNANVDTHFDNRNSRTGRLGRLIAALKNIGPTVGYGVDQNTALYLNGDVGTVYGAGGVFVGEATGSNFGTGSKFSATSVRLSYLTAGDTFTFSSRVITTTKTRLIGSSTGAYQFSSALN